MCQCFKYLYIRKCLIEKKGAAVTIEMEEFLSVMVENDRLPPQSSLHHHKPPPWSGSTITIHNPPSSDPQSPWSRSTAAVHNHNIWLGIHCHDLWSMITIYYPPSQSTMCKSTSRDQYQWLFTLVQSCTSHWQRIIVLFEVMCTLSTTS